MGRCQRLKACRQVMQAMRVALLIRPADVMCDIENRLHLCPFQEEVSSAITCFWSLSSWQYLYLPSFFLLQLALSAEAVVVSLDKQYRPKRLSAALRNAMVSGQALSEKDRQRVQELL